MTVFITIISDTVCPSATSVVPVSPAPSRSTEKQSPADPRRPSKSAGMPAAWTSNPLLNRSSSQTGQQMRPTLWEQFVLARDGESAAGMNSSPGEQCTE
ncbi:uncharacterized protein G6M90_00g047620 [Metarhizium brunneum]|uniref:Uncharacterized protein n=1 Tax=Metarhizium brunneum TaxID=500148 RepID=A0A7D5Z5C7_9HYPO|nr:hypothetical protein G6M90_00g047620 [Metarhizium brunneum]